MPSGRRQRWVRWVLVCLIFAQFPVALAQDVDEGEFSPAMLRYKLEVLNNQFKEAEVQLLTRGMAGSTLKKLERIYHEIKRLEAEFRWGRYYPDLLDEQIVIVGEQLRLTLADAIQITSRSSPAFGLELS